MNLEFNIQHRRGDFHLRAEGNLAGRLWGVWGSSGAGKTTFLHILAGLAKSVRGRIVLDGHVLLDTTRRRNCPVHKRQIGCVFQDNRLFPHLSVEGNLQYARKASRGDSRFDEQEIISLLDLEPLLHREVDTLSGGEQRRVAIARAIMASPSLLLLDEPLTGVDVSRRAAILGYLRKISETLALPILMVSHDLESLLTLTDHLLVFEEGQVVAAGRYPDVFYDSQAAASFPLSETTNVLHLRIRDNSETPDLLLAVPENEISDAAPTFKLPLWNDIPENTMVHVALSADDIALGLAPVEHISIQNQMRGTILSLQRHKATVYGWVDVGVPLMVEVTAQAARDMQLLPGQRVWVFFKAHSLRLLTTWRKERPTSEDPLSRNSDIKVATNPDVSPLLHTARGGTCLPQAGSNPHDVATTGF